MNIFILDESPTLAAQAQHDRHVVKMILESAQMLSLTVARDPWLLSLMPRQYVPLLYKPTHANHPCNVWLRESHANFAWLTIHGDALIAEYHRRFRKVHATYGLMQGLKAITAALAGAERFHTRDSERAIIVDPAIVALAMTHTTFQYAGPDAYRFFYLDDRNDSDVIKSYRGYYLAEKLAGNRWSNALYRPEWLADFMTHHDRYPPRSIYPAAPVRTREDIPTTLRTPSRFGVLSRNSA